MISVFGSLVGEEEILAVSEVMRSQWMGFGAKVAEFESLYKQKFNISNFALVDSGSNALYMAVRLLDIPEGSKIIVPSYTWVSCAQAVLLAGCKPIFCDVEIHTMNISAETIRKSWQTDIAAIMVVHYAGLPVEMDEILEFGVPIIEDAAHAVCSSYRNQPCGTIGDIGIYSYDAVKNLTVGEGGGITSPDAEVIERAKRLRYCGIGKSGFESAGTTANSKWWEYNISEPFIKMLPTNIAAAIGIEQLKKIDVLQEYRREIWNTYSERLKSVQEIILPVEPNEYATHSYFTYCVRAKKRDFLAKFLLDRGIYTTLRYHPLHMNLLYNQQSVQLPNSQQLNIDALSLPLHPRLTSNDVEYVISSILEFYN